MPSNRIRARAGPLSASLRDDDDMRNRVLVRGGAVAAVLALAALAAYLAEAGLDKADKLASVIGVFAALIGLGMSGYGMARERRSASPPSPPARLPAGPHVTKKQANVARDGATLYAVMDGTMNIEQSEPHTPRPTGSDTTSAKDDADRGGA